MKQTASEKYRYLIESDFHRYGGYRWKVFQVPTISR